MKAQPPLIATACRYFMVVAETGSVRAAARHLNVAASAISRQLILLEEQLDHSLFDRSGRSLSLSPAGEVLLRGLRGLSQGTEATLDQLDALKGLKRGTVRVATVESISVSILPDLLLAFARHYPGIQVTVTVAGSDAVTGLVRDVHADLGFTFNPSSLEGLEAIVVRDMHLGAVMAPFHPLAGSQNLTLAQCLVHPLPGRRPASACGLHLTRSRAPAACGPLSSAIHSASWHRWRGAAAAWPSRRRSASSRRWRKVSWSGFRSATSACRWIVSCWCAAAAPGAGLRPTLSRSLHANRSQTRGQCEDNVRSVAIILLFRTGSRCYRLRQVRHQNRGHRNGQGS